MTKSISTTEFMSNFGKYHDEARQHPITLTKHGRPSVVVISADLYERLKGSSDPRRAYAAGEMPRELADAFLTQLDADSSEFKGTKDD
jgi:prevent-host-death family protein